VSRAEERDGDRETILNIQDSTLASTKSEEVFNRTVDVCSALDNDKSDEKGMQPVETRPSECL
jgi:hypothetical protein